ncbi:transglycosylase domain-containing protein [Mediterraneibacter massiliensis]|uniref:transglycosylase domain-containing protein n=1 Tax=Mediterraneibacter massiliensis TaxID=1720300 RepID=UPI0022E9139A|nr:biosynthetic peptidoglycan transglycosylase [Mediterraneibacter massiliensis]
MKIVKRLCSFILLCGLVIVGYLTWQGYEGYRGALEVKSVEEMVREIEAKENYTTLDEMPEAYKQAVLAVEDKRFYRHPGMDPIAVGRAIFHDIQAGAYVEGGSTITQQLAKNQFFTQDKKLVRKVSELFMAFRIERTLDKDKILELYLNSIYFGNGYYCVMDASLGYFGKYPWEMDFDESTLLAGIPNAPNDYNPLTNPELARQRQEQVLDKMKKAGFIEEN